MKKILAFALVAMMAAFAGKYGDKGYLIIVDELIDYLKGRLKPGDTVLCEALSYPGLIAAARALRLRLVGVAMGPDGMDPDALRKAALEVDLAEGGRPPPVNQLIFGDLELVEKPQEVRSTL